MNKTIEHLAWKSGLMSNGTPDSWDLEHLQGFADMVKQAIYDLVKEELIDDDMINAEPNSLVREYLKGCNGGTVDALCHIKNFGVEIEL